MLLLLAAFCTEPLTAAELPPAYLVTELPLLPGHVSGIAYGINDAGQVVGVSRSGGASTQRPVLFSGGVLTDLGLFPDHTGLRTWDINNFGLVSGRATDGPGGSNFGVAHTGSGWVLAGNVGGTRGNAFGVNDAGQVVGNMRLPSGDYSRGYVWTQAGGTVQLPTLFPDDPSNTVPAYDGFEGGSYAVGINSAGVVVGSSGITDTHGTDRAFRWTAAGGMVDLGTPASQGMAGLSAFTISYAQAINDNGFIVGFAQQADFTSRAIAWDPATGDIIDLGTFGGNRGIAYAVSADGTVVGSARNAAGQDRAFGWADGELVDLNTRIDPGSGWVLQTAFDINNSGVIVGVGTFGGVSRGFILTPVPEPAGVFAFLAAAVAALAARRFVTANRGIPTCAH